MESDEIHVYSAQAMRDYDRAATCECGVPSIVLMENAARALADTALDYCLPEAVSPSILIVCGHGNNGGDGYAAARHFLSMGCRVEILSVGTPAPDSDAAVNARAAALCGVKIHDSQQSIETSSIDLTIDAVLGTGLSRDLDANSIALVAWINALPSPIVAADIPSGLDADTGLPRPTAVEATMTVTFAGLKKGFLQPDASHWTGEILVADLSVAPSLHQRFGEPISAFPSI
jgi:NAD(P)H-hydrate epimerase